MQRGNPYRKAEPSGSHGGHRKSLGPGEEPQSPAFSFHGSEWTEDSPPSPPPSPPPPVRDIESFKFLPAAMTQVANSALRQPTRQIQNNGLQLTNCEPLFVIVTRAAASQLVTSRCL